MINESSSIITHYIVLPMGAMLLAIFYFYFTYGYFTITVLNRLTKASFDLDITSIFDLFIAYFFALMVIMVLYVHIPVLSNSENMEPNTAIFLGIVIMYLGRILTKNLGVFYGKVHFSAIFLTGGLLILYRALSALGIPNEISLSSFYDKSINGIYYFIENYQYQILIAFSASIILASIGELFLSNIRPKERKLVSIIEKIPSGFSTYTGFHQRNFEDFFAEVKGEHFGLFDKIDELLMVEHEIENIKCVVKSLWLIERIDERLRHNNANTSNIYVIKRPDRQAILEYVDTTFERDPSPDIFQYGREKLIEQYVNKYANATKIFKHYKTKDYDFEDLTFLIIE